MTPAIQLLQKKRVKFQIHQYDHDPNWGAYGEEAAVKMGIDPERVYKTLVVELAGKNLVVAIIPVTRSLDLKAVAKICCVKKAKMAEKALVEKITGYIVGGVSPLAQKKKLKTIINSCAGDFESICISGGKRGLDIELSPQSLVQLTHADFALISK